MSGESAADVEEENVGDGDNGEGDSLLSSPANLTSMLEDISLLQQSQVDLADETLNTSTLQTYGLEDLSCSLIHCNGGGDFDVDAVKFCEEIEKKDQLILSLYNALKKLTKQRQEGEQILTSVEHQVRYVHKVLKSRADLLQEQGEPFNSNLSQPVPDRKFLEPNDPKIVLNDSNNQSYQAAEDSEISESNIIHRVQHVEKVAFEVLSPSRNLDSPSTSNARSNQHSDEVSQHGQQLKASSKSPQSPPNSSQRFIPVNLDSMRLTYSPTICEYEAEALNTSGDLICHQAIIDDLKLQLADRDRKLEATKKYLSEMTIERETERDEFQHTIEDLIIRCEDLKKEKERSDKIILQQKTDLEDMMENLVSTNRLKDEIIRRSQSSENELKIAVDKICELREIIRHLEDQVEDATRQAAIYSEIKRGFSDDLRNAQEETRDHSESVRSPEEEVTSVLEYTDELHVQMIELARKVEEKLVELENFPWQGRPESSCSVKSGDDVSVRANAKVLNDKESGEQDFFSKLSQGFRRLECNFDGLVRFEEVLMKKFSDAELKMKMEHHKFEELSSENIRLRKELEQCRRKMIDFEQFINESSNSFSSRQYETMRNVGHSFLHRFDDSSPAIKRHRSEDANQNSENDGMSDADDYVDVEETSRISTPLRTARTAPIPIQSASPGINQSGSAVPAPTQQTIEAGSNAAGGQLNVSTNPSMNGSLSSGNVGNIPGASIASSGIQNINESQNEGQEECELDFDEMLSTVAEDMEEMKKSAHENALEEEDSMLRLDECEESQKSIGQRSSSKVKCVADDEECAEKGTCCGEEYDCVDEDDWTSDLNGKSYTAVPPTENTNKESEGMCDEDDDEYDCDDEEEEMLQNQPGSVHNNVSRNAVGGSVSGNPQGAFSGNPQGGNFSRNPVGGSVSGNPQEGHFSGNPHGGSFSGNPQGGNYSENPVGGNFSGNPEGGNFQGNPQSRNFQGNPQGRNFQGNPQGGQFPNPGPSALPPNRGLILATEVQLVDNNLEGGYRVASDDPNVILHELTTVSEFEVEGGDVRYLGSHILPAADLSLDPQSARDSRIDSVSDKIELEKIKTRLNMTQGALEEEKRKSDQLHRQLNQVAPHSGPPTNADNSLTLKNVKALEQALEEQERTEALLRQNIECAMTAIQNLQDENQGLRETIHDLKNDLQRMQP